MGQTATLINGRSYSYVDISAVGLGGAFPGMKSISYDVNQEKPNNWGTSVDPVSRGKGKKDPTGSLDLSMNDIEALRDAAPNGSLLDIPMFNLILVYGNPQKPVTHILENLEFTNDGNTGTEDDTDLTYTLNFVFAKLKTR